MYSTFDSFLHNFPFSITILVIGLFFAFKIIHLIYKTSIESFKWLREDYTNYIIKKNPWKYFKNKKRAKYWILLNWIAPSDFHGSHYSYNFIRLLPFEIHNFWNEDFSKLFYTFYYRQNNSQIVEELLPRYTEQLKRKDVIRNTQFTINDMYTYSKNLNTVCEDQERFIRDNLYHFPNYRDTIKHSIHSISKHLKNLWDSQIYLQTWTYFEDYYYSYKSYFKQDTTPYPKQVEIIDTKNDSDIYSHIDEYECSAFSITNEMNSLKFTFWYMSSSYIMISARDEWLIKLFIEKNWIEWFYVEQWETVSEAFQRQ